MNNKIIKLMAVVIIIALAISTTGCKKCVRGEGPIITKIISVGDFSGIDIEGSHKVVISQGSTQKVEVKGQENLIDMLKTKVEKNNWVIENKEGCVINGNDDELIIYITIPTLNHIDIDGSGEITVNDFNNQNSINIDISGSGNVKFNRLDDLGNLNIDISGSGNVKAYKFTNINDLDLAISGSGKYDAYAIRSDDANVGISGSGKCYIYANDKLNIDISGSGSVHYKGNAVIKKNISGSGRVYNEN